MATLKGTTISETYPLLLKIASSGVDGTLRNVEDGDGTASALQISTGAINVSGTITASGNVDFNGNLDVDGTTNLDVVDIDGATTITGTSAYASSATNLSTSVSKMALRVQGSSDASTSLWMGALANDAQQYIQACNDAGDGVDDIVLNPFGGNVGIGIGNASPSATLHTAHSSSTAYNGGAEILESVIIQNTDGTDDSGVGYVASLGLQVASGATSQGFINYVRTGNNTGDFTFSQRTGSSSYSEHMRINSSGNVGIGETSPNSKLEVAGDITLDSGTGSSSDSEIIFKASYNPVASIKHSQFSTTYGNQATDIVAQDGAGNQVTALRVYSGTGASTKPKVYAHYDLIAGAATSSGYAVLGMIDSGAGSARYGSIRKNYDSPFDMRIRASNTDSEVDLVFEGSSDTEYARFNTSGNLGIGETSPARKLTLKGASNTDGIRLLNTGFSYYNEICNNGDGLIFRVDPGTSGGSGVDFRWTINDVEQMRLVQSGSLNGGDNPALGASQDLSAQGNKLFWTLGGTFGNIGLGLNCGAYTLSYDLQRFYNGNGQVGAITTSGSGTSFTTSSDYRLKENEVLISDGLTRLNQLKPYRFNFIADADTTVDGFFAHEVAEVVPEAITGEKDAVDDDGNIVSQGIDQSKLVPLLVKALQEADDKIDALTARIEALEA